MCCTVAVVMPIACQRDWLKRNRSPGLELRVREGGVRGCLGICQVSKRAYGWFLVELGEGGKKSLEKQIPLDGGGAKVQMWEPSKSRGQTEFIGQFMGTAGERRSLPVLAFSLNLPTLGCT